AFATARASGLGTRNSPPLTFPGADAFLIVDGYSSYSRRDEQQEEGRAMSNAMLGVNVFVPRTSVPSARPRPDCRTVPIV
ncbi:MAG TPA: hypothetical protein VFS35_03315, partial [Terrimicrobiaceae bacterium]|nr:hypothetical protein [Terrimicrobiaceae bacterium]